MLTPLCTPGAVSTPERRTPTLRTSVRQEELVSANTAGGTSSLNSGRRPSPLYSHVICPTYVVIHNEDILRSTWLTLCIPLLWGPSYTPYMVNWFGTYTHYVSYVEHGDR